MGVKSLLDLAVEPVYEEIMAKLVCILNTEKDDNSQGPSAKKKNKEDKTTDNLIESEINEAVTNIRKKLHQVGTCSKMRQKLVELFINKFSSRFGDEVNYQICLTFFDCVLNESFKNLKLIADTPGHPLERIDPEELLLVICKHSPNIENLKLNFYSPDRAVLFNSNFCQLLSKLEYLTSLTLSWNATGENCLPFFESLGESCPRLTRLQLGGDFCFGINQLLAVMLGRRRSLVPQELLDKIAVFPTLAHLRFTQESLTPICSSLQRFKCGFKPNFFSSSATVAFVYRHFCQLQEWEHCYEPAFYLGSYMGTKLVFLPSFVTGVI